MFVPLGIVIVSLFPVLCPIMNAFLKNLIIHWLCKMEGLKIFALFSMFEATFLLVLGPRLNSNRIIVIVVVATLHNLSSTSACLSKVLLRWRRRGHRTKQRTCTSCNRIMPDVYSVDLIVLKSLHSGSMVYGSVIKSSVMD